MSDLDDIRLSVAAFRLDSKFASPNQLINMISAHFIRQVVCHSLCCCVHVVFVKSKALIASKPMPARKYLLRAA